MAALRNLIVVGAINVVATPHPAGIYVTLLKKAADQEVPIWGSDWAKITSPSQRRNDENIWTGRILVWTEIDQQSPWIDKGKNDEASADVKKKISIPTGLEPNFRSFHYALNVRRHRIILEYQNDHGQRFGPSRAQKFFSVLFSRDFIGRHMPDVEVTIVPEEGTIEKILSIPLLRHLHIHVERPNPDDLTEDAERVLKDLLKQGAKSQDLTLNKAPKVPTLKPSDDIETLARVAAENGYVDGVGRNKDGETISAPLILIHVYKNGHVVIRYRGDARNRERLRVLSQNHAAVLAERDWL